MALPNLRPHTRSDHTGQIAPTITNAHAHPLPTQPSKEDTTTTNTPRITKCNEGDTDFLCS